MKRLEMGRSMVEILGVLAIVGVLSIGGIIGYDYAVAKFRANTIMSELNLRAIPISQLLTQHPEEANTALTLEAGDTLSSGQSVSANVAVNPEYFEFHLTEVDDTTCELVLENYETSAWMMVNGNLYENSTDICSDPDNDMTFVYKNDLGERRNCSSKGFFNLETYKCNCAGGTYFDNTAKDCVCPAGHIWSDTERKCIVSRCAPGEFESSDSGCIKCDDPNDYTIKLDDDTVKLCETCPNRMNAHSRCIYNRCGENEFIDGWGNCIPCDKVSITYIGAAEGASGRLSELCLKCPDRVVTHKYCAHIDSCPNGYWGLKSGGSLGCYSCDDSSVLFIGNDKTSFDKCTSCGNRSIIQKYNDNYCAKSSCSSDEFMGANGVCYKCTDGIAVLVGENSGCESEACGRKIDAKNYCVIDNCPTGTHVKLSNGSCYDCNIEADFTASETECAMCGDTRGTVGNNNICRLNNCELGKSFPYHWGNGLCYPCDITTFDSGGNKADGGASCGLSEYAKTYCEACGNYWTPRGNCYMPNSCNKGSEFRAIVKNYKFCTSCDYTEKVEIEDHEKHRDMCTSCVTTPRFFADNYCYRCDSSETPVVSTAEERDSCAKCPNRMINGDNQCVLIQTEEG